MFKTNVIRSIAVFIYLFIGLFCINLNAQLITNGSFENTELGQYAGTEIEGWVIEAVSGLATAPEFYIVDDSVHDGNRALKVVVNSIGTNDWDIQVIADSIPVIPGETYQYSVWAKCENASGQAVFSVGNYSYTEYGVIRPDNANLTPVWTKYTIEFTINDQQTIARGPIHFNMAANVGNTIYIDDMRMINVKDIPNPLKPVLIEAESGQLGADYLVQQDGDISYAEIQTNLINSGNPGSAARIITYDVTFPDTGTYNLFARVRVGASTFDDDSFFYGNGFGEKDSSNDAEWILVNGLAAAGFSGANDVVHEAGGLGSEVWKWVNLSLNTYQSDQSISFNIVDSLTQTFQIGAREDGLDIDKLAFGKSYLYYTVENLDSAEAGSTELPAEVWEGPALASNQPKFVGNIHSSSQISNFESYWNQVTPENAGKWGSVEGNRDVMNWGGLDAAYSFAKDNDLPFNFHVLVWGAQQPNWISDLPPEEQLEEIREWFQAVADRFPDIEDLQVVNEPLYNHNPPDGTNGRANYKAALGGNGETGWDWVINAFRMAREIFPPETKLMLNDYSIISSSSSTIQYLKIIRLLQAENLIDAIGEQGHAFTTSAAAATMNKNLDSLASTGLPIQITEMDIDGTDDQVQLNSYKKIFPVLYEHPGVEGITLWGWKRGLWRDDQGAYIINQNGSERPSLVWLREYLDTVSISPVSVENIEGIPTQYNLSNNYPNPFNPTTIINYSLPKGGHVTLDIFDPLGRNIKTLVNNQQNAGNYSVSFNAADLSSGIYYYRIVTGYFMQTKKMILIK